ncbi:hypothetical protein Hanom_Chr10g00933371 [Helianthus anomalus]
MVVYINDCSCIDMQIYKNKANMQTTAICPLVLRNYHKTETFYLVRDAVLPTSKSQDHVNILIIIIHQ